MRPNQHTDVPGRLKLWYLGKVRWALQHRRMTIAASTAVMILTGWLATTLPSSFQPQGDVGFISLSAGLPPGTRLVDALQAAEAVRARISAHKEVVHVYAAVSPRDVNVFVTLTERQQRTLTQQQLQELVAAELREIPGLRISSGGGFPGSNGPLQIQLTGDDSSQLAKAAEQVEREMRNIPGFASVSTSASLLQPELVIRPRSDRAAELGVTTMTLSQVTRIATSGDITNNLAKLNLPDRQIPIRVRLDDSARSDIEQIKLLPVPSRLGPVPLMNVADVYFGAGPSQITRFDRSRNISITADRGSIPLSNAVDMIDNLPTMKDLPAGVRKVDSGDAEFLKQIVSSFGLAMVVGIFCIYALLVLLFHDVVQPITILSALPPSAGGAIVVLWLLHMDLSISPMIGMLALMGIVTKNSILLVEYVVMARREHGMSRFDAIIDACSKRARPILMTTIAMTAGMLPITLGLHGENSFRAPMGATVVGGLLASTALSLFVVPVIYTLLDDLEHRVRSRFGRLRRHAAVPDAA